MIVDLVIQLTAAIIILVIGWFANKIWNYFRLIRPLSRVLGGLGHRKKRAIIVVPKLYSHTESIKLKRPGDTTETIQWPTRLPLFAEGDAKAMMYIHNLLLKCGKRIDVLEIKSDVELTGEDKRENLVCIGAGSNSISKHFLTTVNPRINFEQQIIGTLQVFGTAVSDRETNERYTTSFPYDYGLIARLKNPNNRNSDVLILAGLGPSGTAASGYFISSRWKEIFSYLKMKKSVAKSYEVLFRTKIADPTDITTIKIVEVEI